jgi:hypothetical protein
MRQALGTLDVPFPLQSLQWTAVCMLFLLQFCHGKQVKCLGVCTVSLFLAKHAHWDWLLPQIWAECYIIGECYFT